jgi:hypothetical protein
VRKGVTEKLKQNKKYKTIQTKRTLASALQPLPGLRLAVLLALLPDEDGLQVGLLLRIGVKVFLCRSEW